MIHSSVSRSISGLSYQPTQPFSPLTHAEIEPWVGGRFRFVTGHPGRQVEHSGEYLEMERPFRLAFTLRSSDSDHVERITVDIEPRRLGCILTLAHDRIGAGDALRRVTSIEMRAPAALSLPAIARSKAKTLRFVPQASLGNLDPMISTSGVTQAHGYNVFDTLYGRDSQRRVPQPQMAEGHTISDDGWPHLADQAAQEPLVP